MTVLACLWLKPQLLSYGQYANIELSRCGRSFQETGGQASNRHTVVGSEGGWLLLSTDATRDMLKLVAVVLRYMICRLSSMNANIAHLSCTLAWIIPVMIVGCGMNHRCEVTWPAHLETWGRTSASLVVCSSSWGLVWKLIKRLCNGF